MSSALARGSHSRRGRVRGKLLRGQLLPVKNEPAEAEDDGEEEDYEDGDPHFLDGEEIAGGGVAVASWTPQKRTVIIKDENEMEHRVTGVFPLVDPWWRVTVEVKYANSQCFTQGHPSYEILEDALGETSMLSLFLHMCHVPDESVKEFVDWLSQGTPVTFSNLEQIIQRYAKKTECMDLMPYIKNSVQGSIALRARDIPLVLRYLPRLLPRHVKSLLMVEQKQRGNESSSSHDHLSDILPKIEDLLCSEPWKLGFGLLVSRELKLYHCEASWEHFLSCGSLVNNIPDLQRHALIIYNELKRKCNELGDTYIEQTAITKAVSESMAADQAWDALKFLKDNGIVVMEGQRVFLHNLYQYEMDIAEYVHELIVNESQILNIEPEEVFRFASFNQAKEPQDDSNTENDIGVSSSSDQTSDECIKALKIMDCPPTSANSFSDVLDEDQEKAVRLICSNPVTVISGKGGCGKTTIVSLVFKSLISKEDEEVKMCSKAFESDMNMSDEWTCDHIPHNFKSDGPIRFLLTAPTGKAASLLKKKTDLPAATLHQVTCSYSRWKKHHEENPESKTKWKFSRVEVLVVDEGSLVSVNILSTALRLLTQYGKLTRLILLGDVRQLPSIQPGNLLADIFTVLHKMKWAVELRTNHRAESQLIVDNATRISQQNPIEFDAIIDLSRGVEVEIPSEDKKFIFISLPNGSDYDLQVAIEKLLKEGPGLQDDKTSQFIAFRRRDCMLINELCCKHYSRHNIKNHRNKFDFQCKDKVCCTKNAYVKDLQAKNSREELGEDVSCTQLVSNNEIKKEKPSTTKATNESNSEDQSKKELNDDERLCNGEIFFITNDVEENKIRELTLSDDDRVYTLAYKALRSRSGLRHAWARTIHTFQGSEEDTVVYVLGPAGRQNWKHVYTAVTRGRKRVYVIANMSQLDQAIANKARERKTRLQQRLNMLLSESRNVSNPTNSPPTTQVRGTQNPYTHIKTNKERDHNKDFNGFTWSQSPPRAQTQFVPTTPTLNDHNTREYGDHPTQTVSNVSNECHGDHPMQTVSNVANEYHGDHPMQTVSNVANEYHGDNDMMHSPLTKRTGAPTTNQTPSKISRVSSAQAVAISPLGTSSMQSLSISDSCQKQLFK
ncbi:DNA helicase B [Pelobates cultripes]|uniref:DNA helicase B n=1 Tax=Pelobates cultripes TaxID=61616 RepID=A0AAD1RUT2_PELCU|nr:DNA helicase B [Pelobates cultripes]